MVLRYCFGMIMSVSTLMIFRGAATPSSVVNLSIGRFPVELGARAVIYPEYRPGKRAICAILACDLPGTRLDPLHIGVRQPEMVPDLVDQDVADDMAQRFLMLGPVIQDRPPVEPDHVGQSGDVAVALLRQADALKQAEQVELALGLHLVQHLVGRKIVDADDHALAQGAKRLRQAFEHLMRHDFHFGERGGFCFGPHRDVFSVCYDPAHPGFAELTSARQSVTVPGYQTWVDVR